MKHNRHPKPIAKTDRDAKAQRELMIPADKRPNEWNLGDALKLRLKNNLSLQEIADHYGIAKSTVHDRFKRLIKVVGDPGLNKAYDECKVEILTGTERVLIQHLMDDQKLKDASLNNVAYSLGQINNMLRLERGQTTGNIGVGVALSEPLQAAVDLIARRAASKNGRIEIEEIPQSGGEDASRPDE
jgi:predicted DNA-binding protein YlxM (UPF0122 family)